tara:strand:+ start:4673 stop:5647 length:975 start_codon:yes stop_codon:yes gene_type:complete
LDIYFTGTPSRRGVDISKHLNVHYLKSESINSEFSKLFLFKLFIFFKNIFRDYNNIKILRPSKIIYEHAGDFNPIFSILIYRVFNFCELLVDCHTCVYIDNNFSFIKKYFNKLIINKSKIFIAHNNETLNLKKIHSNMLVLESKIPDLSGSFRSEKFNKSKFNVVFITRFNNDEPIDEMILATKYFKQNFHFFFTGNHKKLINNIRMSNVTFTGFLEDQEYNNLLKTCDVHVVLTKRDYTLLYGGRESLSLEIPLVVSDNEPCSKYFYKGSVLTNNKPKNIAKSIKDAIKSRKNLKKQLIELKKEKNIEWSKKLKNLKNKLIND